MGSGSVVVAIRIRGGDSVTLKSSMTPNDFPKTIGIIETWEQGGGKCLISPKP